MPLLGPLAPSDEQAESTANMTHTAIRPRFPLAPRRASGWRYPITPPFEEFGAL
jgi:hypothetical protein